MSDTCKCGSKTHYDCGRSGDEHEIDALKAKIHALECEALGHSYIEGMVHDAREAESVIRTKAQKLFALLEKNTVGGYPQGQHTGECYFCDTGIAVDDYMDCLSSPDGHKPTCAWRQAREFILKEME